MLSGKIRPALVLLALAPGMAHGQAGMMPPPPGPYQPAPDMVQMPGQLQAADDLRTPQAGHPQPSATQVWGQPPVMQLPYWMQPPGGTQAGGYAPGTEPMNNSQGGISPAAGPDTGGGGQADDTQLSPAGQTAAPPDPAGAGFQPGFGAGLTPGNFPGYPAPVLGQPGQPAARADTRAGTQPGAYGYPGYSGYPQSNQPYQPYQPYQAYPGYPAFAPVPGQMPVPYWGVPAPYGYGYGAQSQANR